MARWTTLACLAALAFGGWCRAGEFADTMEDELIFLPGDGEESAPASGGVGGYDHLPRFFREMSEYDRIALGPYRDSYDALPLREKAELYASHFEYMHNRKPNYSPQLLEEMSSVSTSDPVPREELYKPPPQKDTKSTVDPNNPATLPGPWSQPKPSAVPDRRMESLRGGWDVRQLLRDR